MLINLAVLCVLSACVGAPEDSSRTVSFGSDRPTNDLSDIRRWEMQPDGSDSLLMLGYTESGVERLRVRLARSGDNLSVTLNDVGGLVISPELDILEDTLPPEDSEISEDLFAMVSDLESSLNQASESASAGVATVRHALSSGECFLERLPPKMAALFPATCGQLHRLSAVLAISTVGLIVAGAFLSPGYLALTAIDIFFLGAGWTTAIATVAVEFGEMGRWCILGDGVLDRSGKLPLIAPRPNETLIPWCN